MFHLAQFIAACRTAAAADHPTLAVREVLQRAIADPSAIDAALGTEPPRMGETTRYDFLHQASDLTVLKVVLAGAVRSPPHNHLTWAVIGMYRGAERSVFYRCRDGGLIECGGHELRPGETMVLDSEAIHGIANPLDEPSFALHVYGASLANPARSLWHPVTLREEGFSVAALQAYERQMTPGR
jgi:predicted metal-dependent enzyme (double-stranded beta helix superfamily)